MCKNKILEKLLAIILIFTLTFANFAFITKSYASSFAEVIFGVTNDTGSRNVEFDAYFEAGGEQGTSVISDVNNKELFINVNLSVKKEGYLKDAKIEVVEANDGEELNFDIRDEISEQDKVVQNQVVEENSNVEENANTEEQNQMEEQTQSDLPENSAEEQKTIAEVAKEQIEKNMQGVVDENEEQENSANVEEIVEESDAEEVEGTTIEELVDQEEHLENFEDNTLFFSQIENGAVMNLQIPIEYRNEQYVREEKASGESKVRFSGIYVDEDGEEKEVSKEVVLRVSWKDEREVKLEEAATKYITYEEGVILQTVERIDNKVEENTLPVKETELEIEVPVVKGEKPSKITVVANTTEGTNGLEAGEVVFGEENWEYNEEENKLKIKVNNEKRMVEVNEAEGEYLQEGEKKEEERLYNGSGVDEYLVTYTYGNVEVGEDEKVETNTKTIARMTTVSGIEEEENKNIVTVEKESKYELEGTTGEIVSINIENKKEEISKAYTYINYNNPGRYEVEIPEEIIVNISYKDIVELMEVKDERNVYVDKAGNEIETNDVYYKRISVSKENFEKILGETGEIRVKDEAGNVINVINKDSEVNESGNIEVGFGEKHSRLSFEMTKPTGEGNIVIRTVKAVGDASVDKETYKNIDKIASETKMEAQYSYVEGRVEVGRIRTEERLTETVTEATLSIDRESLSTIETNTDVEMRIKLNNERETSDVYGHSEFEIELPEYVENVELTNINLLYGEGLEISSSSVEGRKIRVTLDGKQEGINSGALTNGTNIVMNVNIKVNMYAPAKEEKVILRYTNSEATNYVDGGVKEVGIEYSAPTGLVTVNSISNYNAEGSTVTSVRQGKKEGIIGVYGAGITAREELIVMNNNRNTVSNVSILGRIAYKGVKDLNSGEELGTTIDTKLAGPIEVNEQNRGSFLIYYSENGEASKDLKDENNGWTLEPANIETIKSYLIVPAEENYEMAENEILRFAYNFVVPENLPHNEYAYSTFGIYYRNNSEVAKTNEFETADIVGLTTGVGPELKLTVTPSKEQVKEYEEFYLDVVVENVGEIAAENVNVEIYPKDKARYFKYEANRNDIIAEENKVIETSAYEDLKIVSNFIIPNIEIGSSEKIRVYLIANSLDYITDRNNGEQIRKESDIIEPTVTVTADNFGKEEKGSAKIEVIQGELSIKESIMNNEDLVKENAQISFFINVENESNNIINNLEITKKLPNEFKLIESSNEYEYDEKTRDLKWHFEKLEPRKTVSIKLIVETNKLEENVTEKKVETNTTAKGENTEIHTSNTVTVNIAKPILTITQTSTNEDTYIKEGETLKYTYNIRNDGKVNATSVNLSEVVPDGIGITNINYVLNGSEVNRSGLIKDNINITTNIDPGQELVVNLQAVALSLNGASEKSVTNYATLESEETDSVTSNSITHIIEASDNNTEYEEKSSYTIPKNNIEKTYKISGTAWFDSNSDGARSNNEELLNGITVKLIESESGIIQNTTKTNTSGTYEFSGVKAGSYLVIFEYDSDKYTVTTYQKEGVASNANSDAILTTIDQSGKTKNGAVTDTIKIENGSIANIDIGLILINKFDLQLDKTISKVVVQTSKETTTEEYDNVKLAKTDIAAKYLSGSTVFIEYTITVSNVGDIAGYVKKIVDYMPKDMQFNSSLESNKDWYTGSDGNIYSEKLSDKELKPGESAILKLVLTKQMNEENTGIVNNIAEIYEDYNVLGVKDRNSTPGNKIQKENDISSADVSILIKTGEKLIYASIIITTILLGSIVIFITYNKIVISRRKWVI